MVFGGEVATHQADQDDRQHGGTQDDVKTVETGKHIEQRTVHARAELEIQFGDGVMVFVRLTGHEKEDQQHGGGQPELGLAAMGFAQRVELGRAPCRERGCQYVEIPGCAASLKKQKKY